MATPLPSRCSFFVQKKNRFCKMVPGKGRSFCGEHATMEEGVGGSRRITCPLDPKHTVAQQNLEKHLKKCNSREKPRPVYYVENINAGRVDRDQEFPEVSLAERSRADLESLVEKLKAAAEGLQQDMEDRTLSHPILQEELSDPKNGGSAHKHLKQQASLLGHLQELGLLSRGRCFVEFGAGRGKLSHWIHRALQNPEGQGVAMETSQDLQLLLVERCSTRFKVDGKHQGSADPFERLQVDIQHLDLSKVPVLREKALPLVGVGKHLCGAATDLALRCLLDTAGAQSDTQPLPKSVRGPESGTGTGPVLGLTVALCCHHRCEWRHYVGQQFFLQRGLGPAEFSAFCRMSSWATCGPPANHNGTTSQSGAAKQSGAAEDHEEAERLAVLSRFWSAAEREHLGRLCKLLIDSGRRDFLQTRGFSSRLIGYAHAEVTLENVLLTALPSS
ncbi:tRNA:m(4)X modification enzyme TRM13 homolog [Xiphophorus couchianus]|uniref:tRNA:m(4)X modification enzyme TRM13 homolog n=1 Tax=Xiphophorus couchianus TaxID=32473 RepID=UPI0010168554|nr:tRNA:m(4)X modification enzyme TRM13 homolog [Xiphophorus couchianus]